MKLFETCFRDKQKPWECYERYSENGQSYIKKIPLTVECFVPDPKGHFTLLTDKAKRLSRVIYTKKLESDYQEIFGKTDIGLEWIRRNYWSESKSNYNNNPRVWYLDIETTAHAPVNTELCNERIVSIQIYDNLLNINFIFALEDFDIQSHTTKEGFYTFDNRTYDFKLKYFKLSNEAELLKAFFKLIENLKPLIVLAHNGSGFDYAYLWNRTIKLGIEPKFSPFGHSELDFRTLDNGTTYYGINAAGVIYMDSLDIYKKFTFTPRASYSLDALCEAELGERKVSHDCYSTFDGFRTGKGYIRPKEEPSKDSILEYKLYHAKSESEIIEISKEYFIHYSIIDTFLLYNLINKLKLIEVMVEIASTTGCLIEHTLGTIKPWQIYIQNKSYLNYMILPNRKSSDEDTNFKGGFVKEPEKGKYGWTFSIDVTSMYPSQIMAFNMSAETFIPLQNLPGELKIALDEVVPSEDEQFHLSEYVKNPEKYSKLTRLLEKYNIACSLVGTCFSKDSKGIIPLLIDEVFKKRKESKSKMLKKEQELENIKAELERFKNTKTLKNLSDSELLKLKEKTELEIEELNTKQITMKILANALYGCLGNEHFCMYNKQIAMAITGNSRFYISLLGQNLNNYLQELTDESDNFLLYIDTDSNYFKLPKKITERLPKDPNKATDLISEFIEKKIQPEINKTSQELGKIFNALDASRISAKREAIADSAVFVAKKRYFMRVLDSENVRFKEPKIKTMGIDIVRSSTPAFSRKYLKEAIPMILDLTESDLKKWILQVRELFMKQDLMDIAKVSSVSSSKYKLGVDKSIPINSRAFLVSNDYINTNYSGVISPLELGEKVRMLYLKQPNPLKSNIFAFNNEKFARLFKNYVDWDMNFEKFFLKPLEIMVESLKFDLKANAEVLDEW